MNATNLAKSAAWFLVATAKSAVKNIAREIAQDLVTESIDKDAIKDNIKDSVQKSSAVKKVSDLCQKGKERVKKFFGKEDPKEGAKE